jgi:predicted component of type VI protein secretion system
VKLPVLPQLIALSEGPNIPLDKPIVLIGRHQECDIQIPSRKISRRHCCIAQVDDHLVVRDLGSTNGIRINGVKVVEGNLQVDDELVIGNIPYQVKWDDGRDGTQRAPQNGIKAGHPHAPKKVGHDESLEEPVPLPDMALSHPVLQGKPASANSSDKPLSLQIPDNVGLMPLDPPAKD